MPDEHAVLSPSASKRWISCPASVRLAADARHDGGTSVYAEEGTMAHELGEIRANFVINGPPSMEKYDALVADWRRRAEAADFDIDEMEDHAAGYVQLLRDQQAEESSMIMLERRVQTGIPMCWGTSDAIGVSPTVVHITDLKYGMGVRVDAYENPQLMLYGVGALEEYGDLLGDVEVVRMTIFQPRLDHVSTFEMPAADLRAWRDALIPIAEDALAGSTRFGPGEETCRWCPVKGDCRARMEWATRQDFTARPDRLTLEELGELLEHLGPIRQWTKDVEEEAFRKAYGEGQQIPGFKVVLSGGNRVITDTDRAIESFTEAGFEVTDVTKPQVVQLLGLGDLEKQLKLLGKKRDENTNRLRAYKLEDVLPADILVRRPGAPSLVHESDPRPPIDPTAAAAKDFQDADNDNDTTHND